TDAIVNAANNEFWMGSGVAGAIKQAGGVVIEEEAMRKGPVMPGEAIWTGAGQLPFKYVIHGAVMGQDLRTTDKLIRQTTIACLRIADKLELTSIALPAFGTGVGGFPIAACANIMAGAASQWGDMAQHIERVQFCLFDDVGYGKFKEAVRKLRSS
ncbi:Appr-1-p processing protein, partial [candidate division GN15 bacterium]|nr:Appr-1-p processing protein [candidate division GN15 bacterium]